MSIFTQRVLGYFATFAGTVTMSATIAMAALALLAPRLQELLGAALPVMAASLVIVRGMVMLGKLGPSSTITWVVMSPLVLDFGTAVHGASAASSPLAATAHADNADVTRMTVEQARPTLFP